MNVYTKEDFENKYYSIRLLAYRSLGFTDKALEDKDEEIRLAAYESLGFNEKAFEDEDEDIRLDAHEYFRKCCDILGLDDFIKTKFSEDEKELLRFNNIKVL